MIRCEGNRKAALVPATVKRHGCKSFMDAGHYAQSRSNLKFARNIRTLSHEQSFELSILERSTAITYLNLVWRVYKHMADLHGLFITNLQGCPQCWFHNCSGVRMGITSDFCLCPIFCDRTLAAFFHLRFSFLYQLLL